MKDRLILFLVMNCALFMIPLICILLGCFVAWDMKYLDNYVNGVKTFVYSGVFRAIELGIAIFSISAW